jgi:endonuclease-3
MTIMDKRYQEVFDILDKLIPNPQSELKYSNEFELLVAVMLSAQCTDKRVNIVTEELFKVYKTAYDFAKLEVEELEKYIKSCNYYHNKAKNIINASKQIVEDFGGRVPSSHEDLVSLAGVGNKTANVVQAVAFGDQALPVDTHILRVSNRLGFADTKNPTVCERKLKELFVGCDYGKLHHLLLLFGRYYCMARNPKCENCVLKDICKTNYYGEK